MFLHLGSDYIINTKEIIAIYDLDTTTISKISRDFLTSVQNKDRVITVGEDIPKTYIVAKNGDKNTVYLSSISSATLAKRSVISNIKNDKTFNPLFDKE